MSCPRVPQFRSNPVLRESKDVRIIPKCSAARKAMRGKPLYVYRNWRWGTEMPEKKSRSRYDHEEQSSFGTK